MQSSEAICAHQCRAVKLDSRALVQSDLDESGVTALKLRNSALLSVYHSIRSNKDQAKASPTVRPFCFSIVGPHKRPSFCVITSDLWVGACLVFYGIFKTTYTLLQVWKRGTSSSRDTLHPFHLPEQMPERRRVPALLVSSLASALISGGFCGKPCPAFLDLNRA